MVPAKPTVCQRVVNFVQTVEHGEGTRRGVERSVNTLVAHWRPARPGETRRKFWASSKLFAGWVQAVAHGENPV